MLLTKANGERLELTTCKMLMKSGKPYECDRCAPGKPGHKVTVKKDSLGRTLIRVDCTECGRFVAFATPTPENLRGAAVLNEVRANDTTGTIRAV